MKPSSEHDALESVKQVYAMLAQRDLGISFRASRIALSTSQNA